MEKKVPIRAPVLAGVAGGAEGVIESTSGGFGLMQAVVMSRNNPRKKNGHLCFIMHLVELCIVLRMYSLFKKGGEGILPPFSSYSRPAPARRPEKELRKRANGDVVGEPFRIEEDGDDIHRQVGSACPKDRRSG
jgi:hypothetical protein